MSRHLSDEDLADLYRWVDTISLSRPKRNISRDFSDAVLCAEIVKSFFPKYVEMHNYPAGNSLSKKEYNWDRLNRKVFKKINFSPSPALLKEVAAAHPGAIERLLFLLKNQLEAFQAQRSQRHKQKAAMRRQHQQPLQPLKGPATTHSAANMHGPRSVASEYFDVARGGAHPRGAVTPASYPAHHEKGGAGPRSRHPSNVDSQLLVEQQAQIADLKETVEVLQLKISKLEQLLRLKDSQIESLQTRKYH